MNGESNDLLTPPEFETNCNAFVSEVNELDSKYIHIQIKAENETMSSFNNLERKEKYKEFINNIKDLRRYSELYGSILTEKDIDSATCNYAIVDIQSKSSTNTSILLEDTIYALNEIMISSQKYSGHLLTTFRDFFRDLDSKDSNQITEEMRQAVKSFFNTRNNKGEDTTFHSLHLLLKF
jgi:activator of 2-hydroxyglutaryl-CoA dehydratase